MAIDTDFAHQSERAVQAANFGWIWAREFAEESFNQSKQAFDGLRRVTRKMVEDWEAQAVTIREQTTEMTEKTLSNTMEFGQKLARAKGPLEFAQCLIRSRLLETCTALVRRSFRCDRRNAAHRGHRFPVSAEKKPQPLPYFRSRPRSADSRLYLLRSIRFSRRAGSNL